MKLDGLYQYLKNLSVEEKSILITLLSKIDRIFYQPNTYIDIYVNNRRALINCMFLDMLSVDINDTIHKGAEFSEECVNILKERILLNNDN